MLLIISHLGTSIRMWECDHFLHGTFHLCIRPFCQGSCNIVDTANRRNNPDFISDTDFSIRSLKTKECGILCYFFFHVYRFIFVFQQISKCSFDIVRVNPLSRFDIFLRSTYTESVFDNICAFADIFHCHFMSGRNCFKSFDLRVFQ